jgi:hypothetical protein
MKQQHEMPHKTVAWLSQTTNYLCCSLEPSTSQQLMRLPQVKQEVPQPAKQQMSVVYQAQKRQDLWQHDLQQGLLQDEHF